MAGSIPRSMAPVVLAAVLCAQLVGMLQVPLASTFHVGGSASAVLMAVCPQSSSAPSLYASA